MVKAMIFGLCAMVIISARTGLGIEPVREYQIKAGYLYKFLLFTDWPERAFAEGDQLLIGIVGHNPFGSVFTPIEGQSVMGLTLVVKWFPDSASIEKLSRCHLLFISSSMKDQIKELLLSLAGHPVLTVSEMKGFVHWGGIINFVTKKNRVGFEINTSAAERVGIRIRSKMLRVADRIVEDTHEEKKTKRP